MQTIEFTRNLIKGKIAETIFEQMIREVGKYTVIPFGYEHTVPTLAQYQHIAKVKQVMENIKDAPDFALVSEDKTEIYLVEVKFNNTFNNINNVQHAKGLLERWDPSWLFVATPFSFYCAPCSMVVTDNGHMSKLSESWVPLATQQHYLNLLSEFGNSIPTTDPLIEEALKLLSGVEVVSASLFQRRFKVGYARAARIMDELCEAGYIGEAEGAKPRKVISQKFENPM